LGATPDITLLLRQVGDGHPGAVDALFTLVYEQLRALAGDQVRDLPGNHTLQPTALIHEAYLRMVRAEELEVRDRAHFFALAARVMRQLLVDHCRQRRARKRGGGRARVELSELEGPAEMHLDAVLDLDAALAGLAALDERKSRVVELRYFGGLSVMEVAEALDVSPRTVEADWTMARAWLKRELEG
jgi:RNA polymerase sigma factor (TIGR02999 family)